MTRLVLCLLIIQAAITIARPGPEGEAEPAAEAEPEPEAKAEPEPEAAAEGEPEATAGGECEADWKSLSNGCYFTEVKKMNQKAAKDFCTEKKAKMVVMENKEIQAEITAAYKDLITEPARNRFWLDGKGDEKVIKIKDDTEEATFMPWGSKGEETGDSRKGECIRGDEVMNWWKQNCEKEEANFFDPPYTFLPLCFKPKKIQKCTWVDPETAAA